MHLVNSLMHFVIRNKPEILLISALLIVLFSVILLLLFLVLIFLLLVANTLLLHLVRIFGQLHSSV